MTTVTLKCKMGLAGSHLTQGYAMELFSQQNYLVKSLFLLLACNWSMLAIIGLMLYQMGMVRSKNGLATLTHASVLLGLSSLIFLLMGYSTIFGNGPNTYGLLLNFREGEHTLVYLLQANNPRGHLIGVFFQLILACVAILIINNAALERLKSSVLYILAIVFSLFIYPLVGYWVWGHGILQRNGYVDLAGISAIYLSGATVVLVSHLYLGARLGRNHKLGINPMPGGNLTQAVLGMMLFWFGSYGINCGFNLIEATIDNMNLIGKILVNSHAAAIGGLLTSWIINRLVFRKTDITLILNGALMGVIAIAPAPDQAGIISSMLIGCIASFIGILVVVVLNRTRIDDQTGAISIYGVAAICGLFAASFVQNHAPIGLQLMRQIEGVLLVIAWAGGITFVTLSLAHWLSGVRTSRREEIVGMDKVNHGAPSRAEFLLTNRE